MSYTIAKALLGVAGANSVGWNDRMYYEQVYIDTLWQEFQIPPDEKTGDFKISPHHLHIWPKQTYMFIAIPSEVGFSLLRILNI